jgi:hypothetical protein
VTNNVTTSADRKRYVMAEPPTRPTNHDHNIPPGGTIMRRTAVAALVIPMLLLSGCLFETSMDRAVYFNNTTDQTLYLHRRDQLKSNDAWTIDPDRTTQVMLVGQGECLDRWVITRKDGTLVKDPGKMCWHDTVTIP